MNKSTLIVADEADDIKLFNEAAGRLKATVPFEFFRSGDEAGDKVAEVIAKAAILCLVFMVVIFAGFLIYLALR